MEEFDVEEYVEYKPVKNISKCKVIFNTCICTMFILTLLFIAILIILFIYIISQHMIEIDVKIEKHIG